MVQMELLFINICSKSSKKKSCEYKLPLYTKGLSIPKVLTAGQPILSQTLAGPPGKDQSLWDQARALPSPWRAKVT